MATTTIIEEKKTADELEVSRSSKLSQSTSTNKTERPKNSVKKDKAVAAAHLAQHRAGVKASTTASTEEQAKSSGPIITEEEDDGSLRFVCLFLA